MRLSNDYSLIHYKYWKFITIPNIITYFKHQTSYIPLLMGILCIVNKKMW